VYKHGKFLEFWFLAIFLKKREYSTEFFFPKKKIAKKKYGITDI